MINRKAKGKRIEKLLRDYYVEEGWAVDFKPASRFGSEDLFGEFDLIAVKNGEVELVQVKSNVSDFYRARKLIGKWVDKYSMGVNEKVRCYCTLYVGRSSWRKSLVLGIDNYSDITFYS